MSSELELTDYRDRSWILLSIGALLTMAGIAALLIGPIEIYVFKLFSVGGKFHYQGFGFGSFMFANIAMQVLGYYLIALVCILLGYGHLKRKRWLSPVMQAFLWGWLILGIPILVVLVFVTFSVKVMSPVLVILFLVLLAFAYLVLPWLLLRFYKGSNLRQTLRAHDRPSPLEDYPVAVLLIGILFAFFLVVLHLLLFFNGLFPLFGGFLIGLPGYQAIAVAVVLLLGLLYGVLERRRWAWWGAIVYLGLASATTIYTFARASFADLLDVLAFPAREMEFLVNMPFEGYHFALLAGIPLVLTLGVLVFSRKHFVPAAKA